MSQYQKPVTQRPIDVTKIESLDDVKAILGHLRLMVQDDGSDEFKNVRHLYEEDK